jgi:stage II sporulation protein D
VIQPNTWTATLSAAALAQAYPTVGEVRELRVLSRDGYGRYGGRVTSIEITGRVASVTVSGPQFRFATGLRSTLFTIIS